MKSFRAIGSRMRRHLPRDVWQMSVELNASDRLLKLEAFQILSFTDYNRFIYYPRRWFGTGIHDDDEMLKRSNQKVLFDKFLSSISRQIHRGFEKVKNLSCYQDKETRKINSFLNIWSIMFRYCLINSREVLKTCVLMARYVIFKCCQCN